MMADSFQRLHRRDLGVLPPGDMRMALAGLREAPVRRDRRPRMPHDALDIGLIEHVVDRARAAPPDRQGEMLGVNTSGMALARIGGPVLAGQAFSMIAPGAPFALSALMILPALWLAAQVIPRSPRLA